jgi:prepilin peptidase dependent protein B
VIGLMLLAGMTLLFTHIVKVNTDTLKVTHLQQELRGIMDVMVQDIRRSGYWLNAICSVNANILSAALIADRCAGIASRQNPFDAITIGHSRTCILYSYDATSNGILDTAPNADNIPDERFGFRLNSGAVEMRQAGADCDSAGWHDISDPRSVTITVLQFNSTPTKVTEINVNSGQFITRHIEIRMQGRLKQDAAIQRTIIAGIHVRNDRFCLHSDQCTGI